VRRLPLLCALAGCALDADLGAIQRPTLQDVGASANAHAGFGGIGPKLALALTLDTRVDVAGDGSRWAGGASFLGGLPIGPATVFARAGVWRAIVSSAPEAAAVPTFALGAYVPLHEVRPKRPEDAKYGSSSQGLIVGVRDDIDTNNYLTVFVGLALFVSPGY
jgi:hypothetical protein